MAKKRDLWSLVRGGGPEIDPHDLADAVIQEAAGEALDYRTQLLIRDSVDALRGRWGDQSVECWLAESSLRPKIDAICGHKFDEVGFPSIRKRLMEKTEPQQIEQYFRELSLRVRKKIRLDVGGSAVLITAGLIVRHTDDIDVVDEVPKEIRDQHALLDELHQRYGLEIGHFQQHYLPSGWSTRVRFHKSFSDMDVYFVDAIDIFLGKLTSIRTKDLDDLRALAPQFDKAVLVQRLKDTMQSTLACEPLHERAQKNWYIIFGEDLPQ